jgi:hypothetical protein
VPQMRIKDKRYQFWPNWTLFWNGNLPENQSGVDVMITTFCDLRQFSATILAFFSKTYVIIKILHNFALFWVKNANFLLSFSAKIFKK